MKRTTYAARAAALGSVAALVLAACSSGGDSPGAEETGGESPAASSGDGDQLIIGSLLPITGSLAFLGPPEIAGVDLAIQEINENGGVAGQDVKIIHTDSSDADNSEVATQSVQDLMSQDADVIVGAASSSVTLNVVDTITGAEIVQISPANTATALSGYSEYYFRTAPSDVLQGRALGNLITGDGHANVAILVFNDDYGITLRDQAKIAIEEAGGTVVYGNQGQEFDPISDDVLPSVVTEALASSPDAIAVISFDQTKLLVPQLRAAGYEGPLYFTDGNLADYSGDFEPGTLTGSKGTLPGANAEGEFRERLLEVDPELTDFAYAAESYDAVLLAALAAVRGEGTDSATVQANLAAVSGAEEGSTECSGFAECVELLESGEEIDYVAVSGAGAFNEDNDPSAALIGIYEYAEDNTYSWVSEVPGEL